MEAMRDRANRLLYALVQGSLSAEKPTSLEGFLCPAAEARPHEAEAPILGLEDLKARLDRPFLRAWAAEVAAPP
eukprot:GAFH01001481.1.p5 GENE.GAFH01001481.1~~GAFH01001481.1.p5  ORF type:complete len:74 (-),score=18.27 GAFH01001481.1:9-230(-)